HLLVQLPGRRYVRPMRTVGRLCFVAALIVLAAASPRALATHPRSAVQNVAIVHTNVIDVAAGRVMPDMTVLIDGDRIIAVERSSKVTPPAGADILDGTAKYVIPGLWDMHVHLGLGRPYPDVAMSAFVATGITGVRDMGNSMTTI